MAAKRNIKMYAAFVSRRNILSIIILLALIPVLAVCYEFTLTSVTVRERDTQFCSLDDPIYHQISLHQDEWIEHYQNQLETAHSTFPQLTFSIQYSVEIRTYTVDARYWLRPDDLPLFFVVTSRALRPRTILGKQGYFYSHTGQLPNFSMDDIEQVIPLNNMIYCYTT